MPNIKSMTWDFKNQLRTITSQKLDSGSPETVYYVCNSGGSRARKVVEQAHPGPNNTKPLSIMREHIIIDGFDFFQKFDASSNVTLQCLTAHVPGAEEGNSTLVERWSGSQRESKTYLVFVWRELF